MHKSRIFGLFVKLTLSIIPTAHNGGTGYLQFMNITEVLQQKFKYFSPLPKKSFRCKIFLIDQGNVLCVKCSIYVHLIVIIQELIIVSSNISLDSLYEIHCSSRRDIQLIRAGRIDSFFSSTFNKGVKFVHSRFINIYHIRVNCHSLDVQCSLASFLHSFLLSLS